MSFKDGEWHSTDSGYAQLGRFLMDRKYEFKRRTYLGDAPRWVWKIIDLAKYSKEDVLAAISDFHCTMDLLEKGCEKDERDFFIAECLFERALPPEHPTKMATLNFLDGRTIELEAVFCDITGEPMGWATIAPEPGYIGFQVVDKEGRQLILDLGDIDAF